MSAGFSPASLRRLRSWATGLMTDECRIVSHGRPSRTPTPGRRPVPKRSGTRVGCKVQTSGGLAAENTEGGIVQALGAVTPVWSLYLHLPYGTTGLSPGDVAEITAARARTSRAGSSGC